MGPETRNPLERKLDKTTKREALQKPEQEEKPSYLVVRDGSNLQAALSARIEKAQLLKENIHQIGNSEPTGEQVEIVPQTPIGEEFLKSLPQGREFIIYASTHDLTIKADSAKDFLGSNTLVLFESEVRLADELNTKTP